MHVWVPEKDAHLGISQGCARRRKDANKTVACSSMDLKAFSAAFELCEQGADDGHRETAVHPALASQQRAVKIQDVLQEPFGCKV